MTLTPDASPLVLAERYRLEERVGAGSMGAVWRATDQLLNRVVAVKQLLLQPGAPGFDVRGYDEAKQRILREGRLAARLQHPHTIAVFDVVLHDDAPWLVMEYLPSRTLSALMISEAPLDPRRLADIGRQIADGLTAAHAAGIVHRDIKPANVLISDDSGPDATVKITDFGVSRAADDVQLTRTGLIAGTPAYLAPEIARGQVPTPASDVFALGSTLYTAVEGEPPFGLDDNAYALLYKVGAGDIRPPERAGPLTEPLLRMLRKDPADRPTAAAARDELAVVADGWSADRGSPAVPPPRTRIDLGARPGGDTKIDVSPLGGEPLAGSAPAPADPAPAGPAPAQRGRSRRGPSRRDSVQPVTFRHGSSGAAAPPTRTAQPPIPPQTPRRPQTAQAPPPTQRRRAGWPVWVVLALLVVVGAAAAATLTPWGSGLLPGGAPAAAPQQGGATAGRTIEGQPTAADLEGFVRDYYGLLPDQPEDAWALLGPAARNASGSEAGYKGFYATLDSVSFASGPTAVDSRTVRATLRFESRDGDVSEERYEFIVVPGPDGKLVMSSFRRG